jgi:iron complex outermembrane recepter protein
MLCSPWEEKTMHSMKLRGRHSPALNRQSSQLARVIAAVLFAQCSLPTTLYAQQAEKTAETSAASIELEEIVVTAQKRAENVQQIPIAVSALNAETLQNAGFKELGDLAGRVPSLQLSNFGPIAFASVRGIGNENTTAGGDPGVALHFDGVYIGRPVGTLFSAFDTERVEVLRGPQGTLYGRNATGGSINYITAKPDDKLSVSGDVTYGTYNHRRVRSVVNIPESDAFAVRLVGFFEKRNGWTKNAFPGGKDEQDADNWGLRAHFAINPDGSNFKAMISGTYIKNSGVGSHGELREPYPGSTTGQNIGGPPIPGTNNYLVNGVPIVNDLRPFQESKNTIASQRNRFLLLSATLENDFGPVVLKSITGYAETGYNSLSDHDYSPLALTELLLTESSDQFTQEIQILSNNDSKLKWIVGGFYFHEDASRRSQFFGTRYNILARNAGVFSGFDVGGKVTSQSHAFFGQTTYEFTDQLSLTAGIRYTNDRKRGINNGFQFSPPGYSGPVAASFSKVTYRVAADYKITEQVLVYASYSTGYKSGGVNQVINPNVANAIYAPENISAIEGGIKSRFLDRKLQVNISAFRNKFEDLQFQVFGPTGPQAFNAKGATVNGVEAEIVALPADFLQFDASAAYNDATFDDQIIDGVQLGGKRVQRTPKFTLNIGVTANWEVGDMGNMRFRADASHTSSVFYSAFNRNAGFAAPGGSDFAPAYKNVNARLFWFSQNERYSLELYATNMFNTTQIGNVFRDIGFLDIPGGGGPEAVTYRPPRQFGGTFGFNF